jgi:hypothetical protein
MFFTGAELVEYTKHGSASASSDDAIRMWVSHVLSIVLDMSWSWNRARTYKRIYAPVVSEETWTGTAGLPAISSTTVAPFTVAHTGRTVKIGERRYKVIGVGRPANTLILDAPLPTNVEVEGLTLDRDECVIQTNSITSVDLTIGSDKPYKAQHFSQRRELAASGPAYERVNKTSKYIDYIPLRETLTPPLKAPVVTNSGAGTQARGVYYYAYTKVDVESGLESPLGPVTKYVNTTGFAPEVTYGASDELEATTYSMRLWRSDVQSSPVTSPQMYMISLRAWSVPTSTFVDVAPSVLHEYERMWVGPMVTIKMVPPPSGAGLIDVIHNASFHRRIDDQIVIPVGDKGIVVELCKLYARYQHALSTGDVNAHKNMIEFNSQVKWYQGKDQANPHEDPTITEYERRPYPEVIDGQASRPYFTSPITGDRV